MSYGDPPHGAVFSDVIGWHFPVRPYEYLGMALDKLTVEVDDCGRLRARRCGLWFWEVCDAVAYFADDHGLWAGGRRTGG